MRRTATGLLAALLTLATPGAALAQSSEWTGGDFYFTNNGSLTLYAQTGESFPEGDKKWPLQIDPYGGKAEGHVHVTGTTSWSGNKEWRDNDHYGCFFYAGVTWSQSRQEYRFYFTAAETYNGNTQTTPQRYECTLKSETNSATGRFTAYPVINAISTSSAR